MIKLTKYPKEFYAVNSNGSLQLYKKLSSEEIERLRVAPDLSYGNPYECIRMLEFPDDNLGWRLRDYKSVVNDTNRNIAYCQLTLDFINSKLNKSDYDFWTIDIDKAIALSKRRYEVCFPTGPVYDVVSYWDDYDRQVIAQNLLRSEAQKLCTEKNSKRESGSLYHYTVEIHR